MPRDSDRRRLTDEELIAALEGEESTAIDGLVGDLAAERTEALDRYRGRPLGNEVEGRSQVVSRDEADTIESIMPSLARVFLGGEDIGQFEPRDEEDEEAAKRETEICSWYIQQKNDYFSVVNSTLRDALLLKNGYIVAFWRTRTDVMTETYIGQSDEEFALLMQDPEVTVIEHTQYPDPSPLAPPGISSPVGPAGAPSYGAPSPQTPSPGGPPVGPMGAPPLPPPMGPMGQGGAGMPGQMSMPPSPPPMPPPPPPMLHDVKVERKAAEECVGIESVPPDELLVSRRHRVTSLAECDFVEWKRRVSIGQLRAEGFEVDDEVSGDDESDWGQQQIARERYQETPFGDDDASSADPSRRMVTFRDAYWLVDIDGRGTPKLWRMARVSGARKFALKEEAECIPFAAFSPIIYAHSHIGTSIFDQIADVGIVKTQLQRNFLDGQYLALSGQTAVDVNKVNMDDMLTTRTGGIKRVDGNPAEAVFPIPFADMGASALNALGYMDSVKQARTGVSGTKDSLEPNTLNRTATGVQMQQSANNMRVELIARTLAGGFKDLYLIVHALALKYSTKPLQIKLKGDWVAVNPREWKRRTDFTISVGLGTGTPEAQLQKLMLLAQMSPQAQAAGLVGPEEIYNLGCEIYKAAGYRVYSRFLKEPQKGPDGKAVMPPPQPPEAVLVEQERQKGKQIDLQADAQKTQAIHMHEQQLEAMRSQLKDKDMQLQAMLKEKEQQGALALQQSNDQRQSELDRQKAMLEDANKERDRQVTMAVAEMNNRYKLAIAELGKGLDPESTARAEGEQKNGADVASGLSELVRHMAAPKKIVRDAQGRVIGVQRVLQ